MSRKASSLALSWALLCDSTGSRFAPLSKTRRETNRMAATKIPNYIIQVKFAVTGEFGTDDELEFRHLCEERIDHALKQAGFGYCDGGGFGGGDMEIFNYVHTVLHGSHIIKTVLDDMGLIYPTITWAHKDKLEWHKISDGHTALKAFCEAIAPTEEDYNEQ